MSMNGKFNGTDCLPVIGKDGKTQWIFKLEDLKEVVPEDAVSYTHLTLPTT